MGKWKYISLFFFVKDRAFLQQKALQAELEGLIFYHVGSFA